MKPMRTDHRWNKLILKFAGIVFLLQISIFFTSLGATGGTDDAVHEDSPYEIPLIWSFFPNQLITPYQALEGRGEVLSNPKTWLLPQDSGYHWGTYQTRINLNGEKSYSLFFPGISSAATIWVNNNLAYSKGAVSPIQSLHVGDGSFVILNLPKTKGEVLITIQFSNFDTFKSGIIDSVYIGEVNQLNELVNKRIIFSVIFIGGFLLVSILLFALFLFFRKNIDYLYLSVISFMITVRTIFRYKSDLYFSIFEVVPFDIKNRLIYLSVYTIIIVLPLYINTTFKIRKKSYLIYLFLWVGALLTVSTLFVPATIYAGISLDIAHIFFLLEIVYTLYVFYLNRNKTSKGVVIIGLVLCFPLVILEILKNSGFISISIPFLLEFSVLIFFLFQIFIIAKRNANTFLLIESLNKSLEDQVVARTQELVDSNKVKESLLSVI